MFVRVPAALLLAAGFFASDAAMAQVTQRGQAASPGQSRAVNRLPQPPSGGKPTGMPASGPRTDGEHQADTQAKKATKTLCKGC